jgi:bile acid transporter
MKRLFDWFNNLYPVWLVALASIAFLHPPTMLWFNSDWVFWSLAASMLGMGLTLKPTDFKAISQMPGSVALGAAAQYTVMPLVGWGTAKALGLETGMAVGIILVASCPGGMASNIIAYLARANLALSVVLTLCSTMLAFMLTPTWTSTLAGQYVPVNAWALCKSALQLTVAPVVLGIFIRWQLPRTADRIGAAGPTVAVLAFVFVTGGIVAASADAVAKNFVVLAFAAFVLHIAGFTFGYLLSKAMRYPEAIARTVSIEVGMQNGGMAASLAQLHFASMPLAAAAGVFSGVVQNILGGIVASIWKRFPPEGYGDQISSRRDIYYWKCDRPAAFHNTQIRGADHAQIERQLEIELQRHFSAGQVQLSVGVGQGNHLTWNADIAGQQLFIRVENGPERDGQLAVETAVLDRVRATGVRTPKVLGCDASRSRVSFAWQAMERFTVPDLNQWFKAGTLNVPRIGFDIGVAVATWQSITLDGFGVLNARLDGYRPTYADYFHLRLQEHLHFLMSRGFLSDSQTREILDEIERHRSLLDIGRGCLVHKDLALWNILGTEDQVVAFIDFDDAISGDPMDDLSLLACFHDATFLRHALEGYASVRALPREYQRRFWLHLLRNMIVKSVIRVGSGYFDRTDQFFLIGAGLSGADFERITRERLAVGLRGLRDDLGIERL